jgi:predicted GTPase
MNALRNWVIAIMLVNIGLQLAACSTLAVSGDKRYKAELNSVLLAVQSDLESNGSISAKTEKKLDGLLTKYESTYGQKGSYIRTKDMRDKLREAKADTNPSTQFQKIEEAKMLKTEAEGFLTTEIKE